MRIDILLKLLIDNITLVGVFLLVGGFIKLFSYYKLFGIYIYEFLDIQEVLSLFINNCIVYFGLLLFLAFLFYLESQISPSLIYFVPFLFSFCSFLLLFLNKRIYLYEIIFQNIFVWGLFFCANKFDRFITVLFDKSDVSNKYLLLIFFGLLVIHSIYNAYSEYYKVRYKFYYSRTKIEFENEIHISSRESFYIGKTKHYIFIYDRNTNSCIIKPDSTIKKIIFQKHI